MEFKQSEFLLKSIPTEKAIGLSLCHDITEILPNECKRVAFSRGHIITQEDIAHLLRLGKENLFIWNDDENLIHEDDAAIRIANAICGNHIEITKAQEGRVNLISKIHGLLEVNLPLLHKLNNIPDIAIATAHTMQEVALGKCLAGTRVIPLAVAKKNIELLEKYCEEDCKKLLNVLPFKPHNVALIITGSEVAKGRVKDGFGPVLEKKFENFACPIIFKTIVSDETKLTLKALEKALEMGAEFIAVTGGMSVDPDDKTPAAIKHVADTVISYGAPVFPGAMFMLAYKTINHNKNSVKIPIVGLPGCVMYQKASIFDLIIPRILAGLSVEKQDILNLAHGGLCDSCKICHYPHCTFGKGA